MHDRVIFDDGDRLILTGWQHGPVVGPVVSTLLAVAPTDHDRDWIAGLPARRCRDARTNARNSDAEEAAAHDTAAAEKKHVHGKA